MFRTIMVPVDLGHLDKLDKALTTAADLASHYGASVHYVGVTASTPSAVAHSPQEYAAELERFARGQGERHGVAAEAKPMISHDPAVDLDDALEKAREEIGADLVVMGSHLPGFREHLVASNAGYLASHSQVSVFVVR